MNFKMILYILGRMIQVEAVLMLPSLLVSLLYGESCASAFGVTIVFLFLAGLLLTRSKITDKTIYAKEGLIIVALSWIALSLFGGLPFYISGAIPNFVDCFFETVSGFTTTGSTILTSVQVLPKGLLFWRSFTHWIGGMGVLVFVLAIVPLAGERSMHLMRAEVPGPVVGKLVPKIKSTAMILYSIYLVLSLIQVLFLLAGSMPLFDALTVMFGTAGTGGFSVINAGIAGYNSPYLEWVITTFMLLFGINFNLFYLVLIGKGLQALKSEELWFYGGIVAVSIGMITANILPLYENLGEALRLASFQVASIISTTGYATADFNLWPELSRMILMGLCFFGGCAGSTAGGIKVGRILILLKTIGHEIKRMIHPRLTKVVTVDGEPVENETINGAYVYMITYLVIFGISNLLVAMDGFNFETTVTSVITCLNNCGPGLNMVGPMGNFSQYSVFAKLVLSIDMLFGRLEIFPMMVLFFPSTWQRK